MDKTRKILLAAMGAVVVICICFISLNLYLDKRKRLLREIESYQEKIVELQNMSGDIQELELIRNMLLDEQETLSHSDKITYDTIYDFSEDVLLLCSKNGLSVSNYRFPSEQNILEINISSKPYSLARFLNTLSNDRSSWYIEKIMIQRGKSQLEGTLRLGYE